MALTQRKLNKVMALLWREANDPPIYGVVQETFMKPVEPKKVLSLIGLVGGIKWNLEPLSEEGRNQCFELLERKEVFDLNQIQIELLLVAFGYRGFLTLMNMDDGVHLLTAIFENDFATIGAIYSTLQMRKKEMIHG